MKALMYIGLVWLLVAIQSVVLPHVSLWGVRPDLGLVAAAMIGLLAGELEGFLVGFAIGWVFSLYSAGDPWLSLVTTSGAGLFAGLLGRQVAQITPLIIGVGLLVLSLSGGLVAVFSMENPGISDAWWMVQSIVLPQACLDAALGAGLFWLVEQRIASERLSTLGRFA